MVLRIGHRGARGYEPENTRLSFQKALDLKVDMIEFDVYNCKSGEIVLFHDKRVDLLVKDSGYVTDKTLSQLKEYDLGKGEQVLTLDEALDFIDRRAKVNIEIKGEGIARAVNSIIEKYINWKLEIRNWKLEIGNWKLEIWRKARKRMGNWEKV